MIAQWIRRLWHPTVARGPREVYVGLDPALAEVLACPQDKGPLYHVVDADLLYNPRLGRAYRIDGGIPVLLIDEATQVDSPTAAAFDARIASGELKPTHESESRERAAREPDSGRDRELEPQERVAQHEGPPSSGE